MATPLPHTPAADARTSELPVVVIGAGPIGLAAAANLTRYSLPVLVLEAGQSVGAAMRDWGHTRTFTPWTYIVDTAAHGLLASSGWSAPDSEIPPTGAEIVGQYLEPLAAALGDVVRTGARVVAVTREGMDKSRTVGRAERPFLVRVQAATGSVVELRARAVIDASGTWQGANPIGAAGVPAIGEGEAREAGFLVGPLPDVLGRDRDRFAARRTLVLGSGHSAANTLLALARLADDVPGTGVVWATRSRDHSKLYGGGDADQLPARGDLGVQVRTLVESGRIEVVESFLASRLLVRGDTVTVRGEAPGGEYDISGLHNVAAATGFRPDLSLLSEVQLDLDPALEAPRQLAPLIDPQFHSCGTVPPHGHQVLAQPDAGLYIAGMKSYGRAPTFLIATGNEQVRSIAAALAGDHEAADHVELELPETGIASVCGADNVGGASCQITPDVQLSGAMA